MPEIPDVIGGEIITEEWGNAIRDRTVQRYADAAERTSEHGSPIAGDLSFLDDIDVVEVYDGAGWRSLSVPAAVNDIAQEAVSDTTVTTTFENGASINFSPPGGWNTYKITAWGSVKFELLGAVGTAAIGEARISIDGDTGPARSQLVAGAEGGFTPGYECNAVHELTAITGVAVVAIQYRETSASITKLSSWISLTAVRLT